MADHVASIARKYGIPVNVFRALIGQESGGNQSAVSPAGAIGRTQLMPATAKGLGVNPHDPIGNLVGGAKYLRQQLDHFGGDIRKALAAYNAGPGAVEKYGGVPPFAETQNYVKNIMAKAGDTSNAPEASAAKSSGSRTVRTSRTIPGVDNSATRRALILDFLQQRHNPQAVVGLASGLQDARDTPDRKVYSTRTVKDGPIARAAGHIKVASGANQPGRDLTPGITKVLRSVAAQAGQTLTVGTGTNHNKYTVNGNVSDHFTGNATDVPATGGHLTKLGQAALIAAGMDPAQARRQKGGLFNLPYGKHRRIQVIFNTNEGGNHYTHLHVGVTGLGR